MSSLKNSIEKGRHEGREEGILIGQEKGRHEGREEGIKIGEEMGIQIGQEKGRHEGREECILRPAAKWYVLISG
ncbi:FliH/SctL family protein [Candidatus Wolbachia massiliensis]|uniref:Essential protein Yae1 N-terminal domain-containing protein n=1 Tax=Candidatus Wolbachia massiliensis TaxID=1845000 RepID=A0A7L7YRC3_9RICK|nr:hypothetical protein [Candidatus Wolbachia massiliensis]QOD37841.1 hypothetical protein ID128_03140 [Candidatus Wolbachia massiliensis]